MKHTFSQRLLSLGLGLSLLAGVLPVQALALEASSTAAATAETAQTASASAAAGQKDAAATPESSTRQATPESGTAGGGHLAPINPDYLEWLAAGGVGMAPSPLDLSHLAEGYAALPAARATLPERYDAREEGLVGSARDQGNYGTCWAYSTTGAVETSLKSQFPAIELSPAHLAWYASVGEEESDVLQGYYGGSYSFGGGNYTLSAGALAAWKGPVSESRAPYDSFITTALTKPDELDQYASRTDAEYHLQDAVYMCGSDLSTSMAPTPTRNIAKQLIQDCGSINVMYNSTGIVMNETTWAGMNTSEQEPNHGVLIVGWDDNYPKENFAEGAQPQEDGAWLIRNSWSPDWGLDGYFWLSYEDPSIVLGNAYIVEPVDNYDSIYQYDMVGWIISLTAQDFYGIWDDNEARNADKSSYMANVFTAKGGEQLEAVSFYTTDAETSYTIDIYTGLPEDTSDPTAGTLVYSAGGSEPYAGYHTVELTQAVPLDNKENFSVVIRVENPSYAYPVAVQATQRWATDSEPITSGTENVSFVSEDGVSWHDVQLCSTTQKDIYSKVTNVCIKAFTSEREEGEALLPAVRFLNGETGKESAAPRTLFEGGVDNGTLLKLAGGDSIYYTINGGETQLYTNAITLDFDELGPEIKITAWGRDETGAGPKTTRTFTQSAAVLQELALKNESGEQARLTTDQLFDENGSPVTALPLMLEPGSYTLRPMASGVTKVEVLDSGNNAKTVVESLGSNQWTENAVELHAGDTLRLTVTAEDLRLDTVYTVACRGEALYALDYVEETISYDSARYEVRGKDGEKIASGANVTDYIDETDGKTRELFVYDRSSQQRVGSDMLPARKAATSDMAEVIFATESTSIYGVQYEARDRKTGETDWSAWKTMGFKLIKLRPGYTYEIRLRASNVSQQLHSAAATIQVPARRAAPQQFTEASIQKCSADTVFLKEEAGLEYRIAAKATEAGQEPEWSSWQSSPELTGLDPETEYIIQARYTATEGTGFFTDVTQPQYASEAAEISATTARGCRVPFQAVYNGIPFLNGTVLLGEGENDMEQLLPIDEGLTLTGEGITPAKVTVTVSEQDGTMVADTDIVTCQVTMEGDKQAEDFVLPVQFYDENGQRLTGKGFDNVTMAMKHPGEATRAELAEIVPQGWELNDDEHSVSYPGLYYDDTWYAQPSPLQLPLKQISPTPTASTEPAPEPSTGPTPPAVSNWLVAAKLTKLDLQALLPQLYQRYNTLEEVENALRMALLDQFLTANPTLDGMTSFQITWQDGSWQNEGTERQSVQLSLSGDVTANLADHDIYVVLMYPTDGNGHKAGDTVAVTPFRLGGKLWIQLEQPCLAAVGWVERGASGHSGGSDDAATTDSDEYIVCEACGHHDWIADENGYRCANCGYLRGAATATAAGAAVPRTADDSQLWQLLWLAAACIFAAAALQRRRQR